MAAAGATPPPPSGAVTDASPSGTVTPPWGPILVANRGEIAVRIIGAARSLGLPTVAVYTAADASSGHVAAADTAICLGDASSAYTDVAGLVAAGTAARAVAVHPGYGFVAENAAAAEAFEAAGITWVGPTPDTIRVFGSKHSARAEAVAAGVPVLPASALVADAAAAVAAADEIGYPVLLKATAGGGGMGQVPAHSAAGVAAAFASASSAGASLFGDDRLYVEKLVAAARHVEVQVFGDGQGGVVALGDRDCSVQRRRQKVVEEAPAPRLSDAVRAEMAAAAASLAARGRYRSAGTVEFLVDAASGDFFFLEVNTRIQVEAGVTELVTGVDLVGGMLRLARGDPPANWFPALAAAGAAAASAVEGDTATDGDGVPAAGAAGEAGARAPAVSACLPPVTTVPMHGAAIEARVYAESPLHGYRPSPGTLTAMTWPPESPTVRVDTWAATGCTVSPDFDPLLGKIIASGPTRAAALATLADALSATTVRGVASNIELLSTVVAHEAFVAGAYTTALLDSITPTSCAVEVLSPGVQSSLQDHPGRVGLWRVGVSPSGALDAHALVAANGLLGNDPGAVALEMTVRGPSLRFHVATTVVLSGARLAASIDDGPPLPWWTPIPVPAGAVLTIGGLYRPAAAAAAAAAAVAAAAAAVVWDEEGEADKLPAGAGVAKPGATGPAIGAALACLDPDAVGGGVDSQASAAADPGDAADGEDGDLAQAGGKVAYLAVRGGFDAPPYLGSASTFPIGHFGGHAGTFLAAGDLLPLRAGVVSTPTPWGTTPLPRSLRPVYAPSRWTVAVLVGPHGSDDIFTPASLAALFAADYMVQTATNRLGVRLTGPTPEWARPSGGDAGLHPSNMHDYPYAVGAVNFSGNTPIVLMADGPSLGGFVCPMTVASAELWKVAAARPGDTLRFKPVSPADAAAAAAAQRRTWAAIPRGPTAVAALGGPHTAAATSPVEGGWWDPTWADGAAVSDAPAILATMTTPTPGAGDVAVTLRASGDTHVLVEVGECELDLLYRFLVHELAAALDGGDGIGELCPGVRSLLVEFAPAVAPLAAVVARIAELAAGLGARLAAAAGTVRSRVVHLPLAFGDRWTAAELKRYARSVRAEAPYLPSNVEFVRRINGLPSVEAVGEVLASAQYLVLGLGDVYLGAPCAVPVDPRHRLVTSKFNPARTHTPEGAVGIGGAYLCIYGTESPGGYQLVGRTLPIWDTYGRVPESARGAPPDVPWLLRFFDRVVFDLVSDEELVEARRRYARGDLQLTIEDGPDAVFSYADHARFLEENAESIAAFTATQRAAYDAEAARWVAAGEGANNDAGAAAAGGNAPVANGDSGDGLATEDAVGLPGATTGPDVDEGAAPPTKAVASQAAGVADDDVPPAPYSVAVTAGVAASVWTVLVFDGEAVTAGQALVTLESMKVELTIEAPMDGVVRRLHAAPGDRVAADTRLCDVAAPSLAAALGDGSLPHIRSMLRLGVLSADGVIAAAHAAARAAGPSVFITVTPAAVLRERLAALAASPGGGRALPLYGIPFAVKDNIDVAGLPTTAGCPAFAYTPPMSAAAVARLEAAGAVCVGKTNMDQFATGLTGTRSPYGVPVNAAAPDYIPGGSSSGSAAAVAGGVVPFALGTDTAGSGRVPAAMTGTVGLKPTKGRISTRGVVPACRSLDTVSVFARSVADAEAVLDVVSGYDAADPYSRVPPAETVAAATPVASVVPIGGCGDVLGGRPAPTPGAYTFGVPAAPHLTFDGDDASAAAYAAAVDAAVHRGGTAVEVDMAPLAAAAELLYGGPFVAERAAAVGAFLDAHPSTAPGGTSGDGGIYDAAGIDDTIRGVITRGGDGGTHSAADAYSAAAALATHVRSAALAIWSRVDVLLLPSIPRPVTVSEARADVVAANALLGTYTNFVNLMDLSALALPAGGAAGGVAAAADGVPRGVTLVAPAWTEALLTGIGRRWEAAVAKDAGAGH